MAATHRWAGKCARVALVTIALLAITAPTAARAATTPSVTVSTAPHGAAASTLTVDITGAATSASVPLYIRQAGGQDLADASFTYEGTGSSQVIVNGTTNGSFTIPAAPREVLATFSVTGISEAGDSEAQLVLGVDGTFQPITVHVHKAVSPTLVVAGVGNDGSITMTAPSAQFATTLSITSTTATPTAVTVNVSPFRDSSGNVAPVTATVDGRVTPPAVQVPGLGSVGLQINTVFPASTTFTASIVLIYDGKAAAAVSLIVTPTQVTPSVEIIDVGRNTTTAMGSSSIVHTFAVRETAGRSASLSPPQLLKFAREDGTDLDQVDSSVTFTLHGSGAQLPVPFVLAAGETVMLDAHIPNVGSPGQYSGTIRLSSPGSSVIDQAISIFVRRPWWFALILIALGLGLSFLLTQVFLKYQTQLVLKRQLAVVGADLDELNASRAPLDTEETKLFDGLRRALGDLLEKIDAQVLTTPSSVADPTTNLETRISLTDEWIILHRRVRTFAGQDGQDLNKRLDDLAPSFESTISTADLAKAKSALDQIGTDVDAAMPGQIAGKIAQLRDQADVLCNSRGFTSTDRVRAVSAALDTAAAHLERHNVADAAAVATDAAHQLVDVASLDLSMRLAQPPDGVDPGRWSLATHPARAALATVASQDDPVATVETYRRAVATSDAFLEEASAPLDLPEIPSAAPYTPVRIKVPNLTDVRRRQYYSDLGVSIIVFIVAAIAGLQVLYLGNNTWGSGSDMAIAILWGLGLHQAAGQSLNGYAGIRQTLLTPPSS